MHLGLWSGVLLSKPMRYLKSPPQVILLVTQWQGATILWSAMKRPGLLAALMLVTLNLCGQSGLTLTCPHGGSVPACVGGEIEFTGSNYGAQVHVTVTNSSGKSIDDGDYMTDNGVLTFTENLSFADTYTITLNG